MSSNTEKVKFKKYEKSVRRDLERKGFSFVDSRIIQSIEGSSEKTEFLKNLEGEKYITESDSYPVEIGRDSRKRKYYFIYDDRFFNEPVRVKKVVDLLGPVLKYNETEINRYFRGQKAKYGFTPSLFRDNGKNVMREMELNARVYNDRPKDFSDCDSTFDKLVKLKHYLQPSRLLDVSSSPLVALFFACFSSSDEVDNDTGVVLEAYSVQSKEKYSVSSDTVVMLTAMTNTVIRKEKSRASKPCSGVKGSEICPKKSDKSCYENCLKDKTWKEQKEEKDKRLDKDWARKYIYELSHQCKKEGMTIYWDDVCFNELNQCILVRPPLNNDRIVRQQGCFIMCGMNPDNIYEPPKSLYDYLRYPAEDGRATFYYILPDDKKPILNELKLLGLDEYYFFPELEKEIKVVSAVNKRKRGSKEKQATDDTVNED